MTQQFRALDLPKDVSSSPKNHFTPMVSSQLPIILAPKDLTASGLHGYYTQWGQRSTCRHKHTHIIKNDFN